MREKTVEEYIEEMKRMMKKAEKPIEKTVQASLPTVLPTAVSTATVPTAAPLPMDGTGSLIVVVNSAESRPLKGATVVISEQNNGETLYTLTTDESGKTAPVRLVAPLREASLTPGNGEIVYGLYDITASADNFVTSTVTDIPVFDSVVSIQQMRLLWLPAAGGITGEQTENEGNPYTLN